MNNESDTRRNNGGHIRQESPVADGGTDASNLDTTTMSQTDHTASEAVREVPLESREFLLEVVRRGPILESLQEESVTPSELSNSVDMSRSTVHRAVKSLEEYDVIEESDGEYELTNVGQVLTREMQTFGTRANTALAFKKFLNHIEIHSSRIPLEYFTSAKTTRRTARQPHATLHQIIKLIENTNSIRMFSTVASPVHVDVGYRVMMNGTEIEAIFNREVIEFFAAEFPEKAEDAVSTGNFDVYAHEGLPFELFILEEKIGLAAHNENGNAEILIECENQSAIEWAENLYAEYRENAESVFDSGL